MEISADRWYEAISLRHSRRQYEVSRSIPAELVTKLKTVCSEFQPFPGTRAEMVLESPEKIFNIVAGAYGLIRGHRAALAFVGNPQDIHTPEQIGYTGEGLILEATALGLDSCWVSGTFSPASTAKLVKLKDSERVFAASPLGYTRESKSLAERAMSRLAGSRRRKPLSELISGLPENQWPAWIKPALEAARSAPSAANRQPWRFRIETNSITVSMDPPGSAQRLDCGIAMLHLEITARHYQIQGHWEFLDTPRVARFVF